MAFIYKSEIELYAVHSKPPFPETLLTSYDNNSYMTNCHGCQHDVGWAPRSGWPGGRFATPRCSKRWLSQRWILDEHFLRFEAPAELSPDIHKTLQMFLERRRALSIAGLKLIFHRARVSELANQWPASLIVKWKNSPAKSLKVDN